MSNQQTISDLRQSIQALEAQDADLVARQNVTSESINQITQQIEQISRQASRLPFNSPERIALNQQARDLDDRRQVLRAQNNQLSQQILDVDAQIQRFERQIDRLENGGTLNESLPVTESVTTSEGTTTIIGDPFNDENTRVTQEPVVQGDAAFDPNTVIRTPPAADPYNLPTEPLSNLQGDAIDAAGGESTFQTQFPEDGALAARPIPNSQNPPNSANYQTPPDWRVRLSLAPGSNYLYRAPDPGILRPLQSTAGVVYPYTPQISVTYSATYDQQQITHSNYKFYTYQGSAVDNITIQGDFTAQNVDEANYVLAVIHFFRSATKMFYGQDLNPSRGVPPPLLYLTGHGSYQFDNHPVVISAFTYNLPTDVDYINAYPDGAELGATGLPMNFNNLGKGVFTPPPRDSATRLRGTGVAPGGGADKPQFPKNSSMIGQLTRVPTKISLSVTLLPIITRYAVSNKFSLREYASGALLRGSKNTGFGGGMW